MNKHTVHCWHKPGNLADRRSTYDGFLTAVLFRQGVYAHGRSVVTLRYQIGVYITQVLQAAKLIANKQLGVGLARARKTSKQVGELLW